MLYYLEVEPWRNGKHIKTLLDLFCTTSRMSISLDKSSFLSNNLTDEVSNNISAILPYKMEPIDLGFKYLGFRLKPLGYCLKDWRWIIKKFENKIGHWTHKFLSLGGRLILIRYVLSEIPVYWFSLARIPRSILNKLIKCFSTFLWGGTRNKHKLHLVDWTKLSRPFSYEG